MIFLWPIDSLKYIILGIEDLTLIINCTENANMSSPKIDTIHIERNVILQYIFSVV